MDRRTDNLHDHMTLRRSASDSNRDVASVAAKSGIVLVPSVPQTRLSIRSTSSQPLDDDDYDDDEPRVELSCGHSVVSFNHLLYSHSSDNISCDWSRQSIVFMACKSANPVSSGGSGGWRTGGSRPWSFRELGSLAKNHPTIGF